MCSMTRSVGVHPRWLFDGRDVPALQTRLPGPNAETLLDRDSRFVLLNRAFTEFVVTLPRRG